MLNRAHDSAEPLADLLLDRSFDLALDGRFRGVASGKDHVAAGEQRLHLAEPCHLQRLFERGHFQIHRAHATEQSGITRHGRIVTRNAKRPRLTSRPFDNQCTSDSSATARTAVTVATAAGRAVAARTALRRPGFARARDALLGGFALVT